MAKKKSCQNVCVPRVLSVAERELYGWVDEEIFTQPSVVEADMLPELRHEMRLMADRASEGDFVLEAAGPSDRLPFQAQEDRSHFLWVYMESFSRLGVRLPFTDFQKEVLSRCRVAASQLHLNGWGFLLTFERVCFQEFKWHYFKVLPFPETLAFDFLQSHPAGLGKKFNFKCRWILDHSDTDVGEFLGRGKPTNATTAKTFSVEREEGAREDQAPDLRQKRRKRKVSEASAEEAALGGGSAWKHKVNPIDRAFPPDYNFRTALDAGLTNGPIWEILGPLVSVENTFAAKVQLEKELAATKDQVDVLTAERDSALAAPLLHAKIKSLSEELECAEGECLFDFDRMKEVKERAKVQAAELESCCSTLAQ
ncbi:hypothetical protein PIB30_046408 [Stylosanthes scabra]|uniref:Transposase (Putative), gypsy type n=1 Tax=Stylosanthes scabra TaxID=79078 RepID=A0ABU6THF6_9FABA|nr:hypothetical protein [Stylosanthes scabra]